MNRRGFLVSGMASAAIFALPNVALALNESQASALVQKVVNDINKVIASGKSVSSMIRDFEKIFVKYADVPNIARSTLGVSARSASKSQLNAYTKAFQGYLSRKYGKRFEEFKGGEIIIKDARPLKRFYEVRTQAKLKGQSPFDVNFMVSDKTGRAKFFDMKIEGISLLVTEREEIGAMLDKRNGNIDLLIKDLKKSG
ncbi:ABC transporter substrate-binding protein [Shimia litoralis]|uniref:ABC transporter substrate-binding protein n=1 Tax=Shimia litoralis TaxID=420403 RepID=A0A4V6F3C3_9RHOB|nr:ABC transporter substrate-binding protein [Shimia litoralis]TKZ21991.1 ABC transporter substrate-binding protein [Shimia litoralis]